MPSNHIILCCPLLLLPSMFPSITVFSNESVLRITWPTYWSCSFNISPSNEYPGLISFMMDWLDLLAVIQSGSKYHSKWKWSLWFHLFHRVKCLRHNTLHFFFLTHPVCSWFELQPVVTSSGRKIPLLEKTKNVYLDSICTQTIQIIFLNKFV